MADEAHIHDHRTGPEPIALQRARGLVLEGLAPLPAEPVALHEALGRILARDAVARAPAPAFDNSAMDGFALRSRDVLAAGSERPVTLEVVGESRAGRPARLPVGGGQAIAISTGAMLPAGADAILPIELARVCDGQASGQEDGAGAPGRMQALETVPPGACIRRAGEDVQAGQTVVAAGSELGPAHLGVLASLGLAGVRCVRRPRLTVVTTGDELVQPGAPLGPGQLHDSNGCMIAALACRVGGALEELVHVPDDPARTRATLARAVECSDVTVVCGGISVGTHDHVRASLRALGVREVFWGVALKPGRPTWFGRRGQRLIFGLPGNPVSAMVTFALFVAPALRALGGAGQAAERPRTARVTCPLGRAADRTQAIRCRLALGERGWLAEPRGHQGSHALSSTLDADALAIVPAGRGRLAAGELVEVQPLAGALR